jgi:hypothetical protein
MRTRPIWGGTKPVKGWSSLIVAGSLLILLLPTPSAATTPSTASATSTRTLLQSTVPTRVGYCGGDDWEPEIATDTLGHVYVVFAHFPGDPTCGSRFPPGARIATTRAGASATSNQTHQPSIRSLRTPCSLVQAHPKIPSLIHNGSIEKRTRSRSDGST